MCEKVGNCDLPEEIDDSELICRAVKVPAHYDERKKKLKPAAYRSIPGTDDISTIRHTHMGHDFCSLKCEEIVARSKGQAFGGIAVISAANIRTAGSEVQDTREEYCGHASIRHGITAPPANEPLDPETSLILHNRLSALVDATIFPYDPTIATSHST